MAAVDGSKQMASTRTRSMQRYSSVLIALAAGVIAGIAALLLRPALAFNLFTVGFFFSYLAVIVFKLPRLTKSHLRSHADESDIPGYVIIAVALATVIGASASLFVLLNNAGAPGRSEILLGILSVVLGWLCVHTMLAFHYAYEYYGTDTTSPPGKDGVRAHVGGLDFPGSDAPDGLSFLYFSFVIAMTAQVSDVTVTSNTMRAHVLLHGILAFFFNTVILAIAVNVVVTLAH